MKNDVGVMIFGRMNPVHSGHLDLLNYGLSLSPNVHLYTSETHDEKNILTIEEKCNLIKIAFPTMFKYLKVIRNPFMALRELELLYKNIIFVCGEDRYETFKDLLPRFNGTEFTFDSIEVKSLPRNELSSTSLKEALSTGSYGQVLDFYRVDGTENEKSYEIIEFYNNLKNLK